MASRFNYLKIVSCRAADQQSRKIVTKLALLLSPGQTFNNLSTSLPEGVCEPNLRNAKQVNQTFFSNVIIIIDWALVQENIGNQNKRNFNCNEGKFAFESALMW